MLPSLKGFSVFVLLFFSLDEPSERRSLHTRDAWVLSAESGLHQGIYLLTVL